MQIKGAECLLAPACNAICPEMLLQHVGGSNLAGSLLRTAPMPWTVLAAIDLLATQRRPLERQPESEAWWVNGRRACEKNGERFIIRSADTLIHYRSDLCFSHVHSGET